MVRDIKRSPLGTHSMLRSALVRRIRRDPASRAAIESELLSTSSPNAKSTLVSLLATSGGMAADDVRSWCAAELHRQFLAAEPPELGFDLIAGRVRSVGLAVLDALDGRQPASPEI
jgi:hypothetical protein